MRLIDADALQNHIKKCCCEPCEAEKRDYDHVRCRSCEAGDALDWIDDAPTIEPESLIPYGRWIEYEASDSDLDPRCRCSKCGSVETPLARHSYCPNCGAKMDKEA